MVNSYLKDLLDYLETLAKVQAAGHFVNDEIKEVIREIRAELGLDKIKREHVKSSRMLVFEGKLGHSPTFIQRCLFEAVFNSKEHVIIIPFWGDSAEEVYEAVDVLQGMSNKVSLKVLGNHVEVERT